LADRHEEDSQKESQEIDTNTIDPAPYNSNNTRFPRGAALFDVSGRILYRSRPTRII
jgi:hypothetical protein